MSQSQTERYREALLTIEAALAFPDDRTEADEQWDRVNEAREAAARALDGDWP